MTSIPEDIMKAAEQWANSVTLIDVRENWKLTIARALLAERERCALYIEQRNGEIQDRQEIAAEIRRGGDAS